VLCPAGARAGHACSARRVRRFRPMNSVEKRENSEIVTDFDENLQTVRLKGAAGAERDGFTFDRVFPIATQQAEVFDYGVKECVARSRACVCGADGGAAS
jgi:hypothetical protein